MSKIIFITKDILMNRYLFCNSKPLTEYPNINELALKGTIFKRHYTAAPSTAMSLTSMFTGKYAHEMGRKRYIEVDQYRSQDTLFDEFIKKEYSTYVIWPWEWKEGAWKYSKIFPNETKVIPLIDVAQSIVMNNKDNLSIDIDKVNVAINNILKVLDEIVKLHQNHFVWLHLPHVINGMTGYGSDIGVFDGLIGSIRELYGDESIYLSADHGHMNGAKGIPVYGFHFIIGCPNLLEIDLL